MSKPIDAVEQDLQDAIDVLIATQIFTKSQARTAATLSTIRSLRARVDELEAALDGLPEVIDIYRAIKQSGARKQADIAKTIAAILPRGSTK